jgi:hypothetical protein
MTALAACTTDTFERSPQSRNWSWNARTAKKKTRKRNADCVSTTGMDMQRMFCFLHHPMDAEAYYNMLPEE